VPIRWSASAPAATSTSSAPRRRPRVRVCVVGSGGASTRSPTCSAAPPRWWSRPATPASRDRSRRRPRRSSRPVRRRPRGAAGRRPGRQLRAQGAWCSGRAPTGPLEGSKAWMKEVVARPACPTARYARVRPGDRRSSSCDAARPAWVVKTDGLAAGKGVLVAATRAEAEADVRAKLAGQSFGDAGRTVVDRGGHDRPRARRCWRCATAPGRCPGPAQDFKRIGDGDTGPNTGGMGAYSPVPGGRRRHRRRRHGPLRRPDAGRAAPPGASTTAACSTRA
jgi:phosphoribosylamine--glycine ligase